MSSTNMLPHISLCFRLKVPTLLGMLLDYETTSDNFVLADLAMSGFNMCSQSIFGFELEDTLDTVIVPVILSMNLEINHK